MPFDHAEGDELSESSPQGGALGRQPSSTGGLLSICGLAAVVDFVRIRCARGEPYLCSLRRPELAEAVTKGPGQSGCEDPS